MQGNAESREVQAYRAWSARIRPGEVELELMRHRLRLLDTHPRVSILLVVADEDEIWIAASATSVFNQVYDHVDLCVCDNASSRPHVAAVLRGLASDGRVQTCSLPERDSQARAWNEALELSRGEYVAVLDPGDEIAPETLFRAVELLATDGDLVYTDEDEIDVAGRPSNPTFKPSWSPDLLLSTNYVGRLSVARRSLVEDLGGFRHGFEGAAEHDLTLRLAERTDRIRHLPWICYHRRRFPQAIPKDDTAARSDVLRQAVKRRGIEGAIEPGLAPKTLRVVRDVPGDLRTSVISMATEPSSEYRSKLEDMAGYPIHEVLEAGRPREDRDTTVPSRFPARTLNLAAQEAEGEYLVFLGVGTTPVTHGWLSEMLRQAHRRGAGAVGGRLLEGSSHRPRAGGAVTLALLGGEEHAPGVADGARYQPALDYPCNFPVAGEWIAVRRAVFEDAGGFDEENLPTAFFGLDLSLRLEEAGLLNVYTPHAGAIWDPARPAAPSPQEIAHMWGRWWSALVEMLYYASSPVRGGYDREALETVLAASLSRAAPTDLQTS